MSLTVQDYFESYIKAHPEEMGEPAQSMRGKIFLAKFDGHSIKGDWYGNETKSKRVYRSIPNAKVS